MLGWLSGAGARALGGSRFLLINVLPGALVALVVVGAYRSGLYGRGPADLAQAIPTGWAALQLGFAMLLFGVVAQPFQIAIVQALEGYGWDQRLPPVLAEMARERHLRRLSAVKWMQAAEPRELAGRSLAATAAYARALAHKARLYGRAAERRREYPINAERLMPTRLGNVLAAAEEAAGGRYGLDSMTVYPRMYPYISPRLEGAIRQQLDLLDTTSALCVSFAGAALATTPILVIRLDLWGLLPALFAALAWLAYRAAVRTAKDHGDLFATAFDLHRFDMIEHLHYPLPAGVGKELRFNKALSEFLGGRHPLTDAEPSTWWALSRYRHPRPPDSRRE
jgi:hypothetical protein